MKKFFLLCLSILLMTSFTACLLEDEDCLDSGNCETNIDETDSTDFNDSLNNNDSIGGCYQIYAPVCGNGQTFPNDCYAEVSGVTDYTEGECLGKDTIDVSDSLIICAAISVVPSKCSLNELLVYRESHNGCVSRATCELKEKCEPIVEAGLIDCASGLVPRLVQDDQGCYQNQCVGADPICRKSIEVKNLSILPVEPEECEEIYDEEGCYLTSHCL